MPRDALYLANDAARLLNCSPTWIRALAKQGRLPHRVTVGGVYVFRHVDIERLLAERSGRRGPADLRAPDDQPDSPSIEVML